MSDRFDHTFDRKLETKADAAGEADGPAQGPARRIELIAGTARRRDWSDDDKARIIVESLAPGANISAVARRHGIKPQQLFGWRREARELFRDCLDLAGGPPSPGPSPVRLGTATKVQPPVNAPTFAPVVMVSRIAQSDGQISKAFDGRHSLSSPASPRPFERAAVLSAIKTKPSAAQGGRS